MSTYKRINGDYTIQTVGANDKININSPVVTINGNLFVTGNSQQVVSTNSAITDNLITLNHGVLAPNPNGAAIEVDRGTSANVQLRWNETVQNWQLTKDGSTYANITTGTGGITSVSADPNPSLGGNLNLSGHTIWDSTTNASAITLGAVGGAGSGVYVTPVGGAAVELVSQSKALAYSIIFG